MVMNSEVHPPQSVMKTRTAVMETFDAPVSGGRGEIEVQFFAYPAGTAIRKRHTVDKGHCFLAFMGDEKM